MGLYRITLIPVRSYITTIFLITFYIASCVFALFVVMKNIKFLPLL